MNTWRIFWLVSVIGVLMACGEHRSPVAVRSTPVNEQVVPHEMGTIHFDVTYVDPAGRRLAKLVVVDRMTAYVYESTGTEMTRQDLVREGDRGKAEITVSAGDNRSVDLVAYEGARVKWFGVDTDVDVQASNTTTAEMTMRLMVPGLGDPGDTTTVGNYPLRWSRVAGVTGYVVEEDTTISFAIPKTVYSGSDTSATIAGKGTGTYFYRVRIGSMKTYGEGVWSNVQSIMVKPEGQIQIDVPWPPDTVSAQIPQEIETSTGQMVLIPAGVFIMGDTFREGWSDEQPQHPVSLDAFYIDKYEVTNVQYKAFCDATHRTYPPHPLCR